MTTLNVSAFIGALLASLNAFAIALATSPLTILTA